MEAQESKYFKMEKEAPMRFGIMKVIDKSSRDWSKLKYEYNVGKWRPYCSQHYWRVWREMELTTRRSKKYLGHGLEDWEEGMFVFQVKI